MKPELETRTKQKLIIKWSKRKSSDTAKSTTNFRNQTKKSVIYKLTSNEEAINLTRFEGLERKLEVEEDTNASILGFSSRPGDEIPRRQDKRFHDSVTHGYWKCNYKRLRFLFYIFFSPKLSGKNHANLSKASSDYRFCSFLIFWFTAEIVRLHVVMEWWMICGVHVLCEWHSAWNSFSEPGARFFSDGNPMVMWNLLSNLACSF